MLGRNETRFLVQHKSCEFKRTLNESVCNSQQKWNHDECSCECKELVKHMNAVVFNLMSGVNETRFLVRHELPGCKCALNESVCNSKQKWIHD